MAHGPPGEQVEPLSNPAIGFGDVDGNTSQEKYNAFAYSLDFNLSLLDPSRLTISFISDDRNYDEEALKEDIINVGAKGAPEHIVYCGGAKHFFGFPLKYSINRSPRGDILTVDYYDASIQILDNTFVLLNGQDMPAVNPDAVENKDSVNYKTIASNPCEWGLFNLGTEYFKNSSSIPQANEACIDRESLVPEVLYTNHELAAKIEEYIAVDESLSILSPKLEGGEIDPEQTYVENYHGTLRSVLKQWGERMGFTFYWEPENLEADDPFSVSGKLVFLDLKSGLFYDDISTIVGLMLGEESGGACNLLESTSAHTMDQTFNKAISARYENNLIGDSLLTDKFMTLDLFSLPIRGCSTDVGKEYDITTFKGGIQPSPSWPDGNPQYRWRTGNSDWYKEWDNPNYSPDPTDEDVQERHWLEYQPIRPSAVVGDATEAEFRDYIRLVKAAAIGQDFFKAYIFFKMMKAPRLDNEPLSLKDYVEQDPGLNASPDPADPNDPIVSKSCRAAVKQILAAGGRIVNAAGAVIVPPATVLNNATPPTVTQDNVAKCCGDAPKTQNGALVVPPRDEILAKMDTVFVEGLDANSSTSKGILSKNGKILIPDLVQNLALNKILSDAPDTFADPQKPPVDTANVKLCRGTVLGRDCLTVKVLDPIYKAVKQLYKESSEQRGPCGNLNSQLSIDSVDESPDVYRAWSQEDQAVGGGGPDGDGGAGLEPGDAKNIANGSAYIFTYLHNYGNSIIFDSAKHSAFFRQLKFIAENAGRWWVSPELLTAREFKRRSYTTEGISFTNRLLDVHDTPFRGLFQTFDPMAGRAQQPWGEDEHIYDYFWGDYFNKTGFSYQKQLNGFEGEEPPKESPPQPCDYGDGEAFGPGFTDTGENTRAPNMEQMVEKIIEKMTIPEDQMAPCQQTEIMSSLGVLTMADMPAVALRKVYGNDDDPSEITGYRLKSIYDDRVDFEGGFGYSSAQNAGVGPTIEFHSDVGDLTSLSVKTIIDHARIKQIIIENPEDAILPVIGPGGIPPSVQVTFEAPSDGPINFFKNYLAFTNMSDMDSITSANLSLRQKQKELACCCTDLEEGVVMLDEGEQLELNFNTQLQRQVKRLADATNKTINQTHASNLVHDYKRDNKLISFSTNLIPIDKLGAPQDDNDPQDELDWIVDHVRIGVGEGEPTYKSSDYMMPITQDKGNTSGLTCMFDVKIEDYTKAGQRFEMTILAIPQEEDSGPDKGEVSIVCKTLSSAEEEGLITDCSGFIHADGINAREMQIEFVTPSSEDLGVEFECGKKWSDLTKEEQTALLKKIQVKLVEYACKRAYLQDKPSREASVTIADNVLLDADGAQVKFPLPDGADQEGIPSIGQGLESLSIKVDGNGQRISISVGTRKKLRNLREPNFNLWRGINPRTMNQLEPGVGNQ